MRRLTYLLTGAVFGGGLVAFALQGIPVGTISAVAASSETYRQLNLFGDVFEKIRTDYVEKPEDAKLIESAISGMLSGLDPHSSYMDPKSFKDMQVQTKGEFGGLGIEVTQEDGFVKVVTPIDDTPASRAGLLAGDFIVEIDGDSVQGLTLNQAVDRMRGPVNSSVKLRISRKGTDSFEVSLKREIIKISSVKSRIENDVSYIRITQFTEKTSDGLKNAIDQATKNIPADKLKGYIVDLRNDPGGLLDQAIAVSDAFLERGEIVSTRGRNPDDAQRYVARSGDLTGGKPVVVLINGGSASASEIVAGALQDHKRATIIGTRSFGKGSVQTIIPLGPSGALRLTTARYYTPSGRSIQAKGIDPDIQVLQDVPDEIKGKDETKGEAALKGHLKNGANEQGGSSAYVPADPKQDKQLQYAFDLLRGIKSGSLAEPSKDTTPAN
ncbi:MAG: S41 family peptidase [Hyphomicrobiales bacterium]|nr:S41 family peptidase [Hyphomicrobiales bacterium]